jgi:hypothetical protein
MEGHRFPADVTTVNVADSAVSIRAFDAISGLIIADEIGRIISYNGCFVEKLFGYTDGQVPIGNISDMLPDYAQLRADAAARPSQQCSPSPSDMPYTGGLFIIHKDGSRLPVEIYIRRLHEQSKPLFALWISFTRSIKPFLSSSQAPSSLGRLKAASSVQISDKEPQVVAPGQQTGNRRLSTVSALDRYEILSKIGQGAFGAVYKVAHKSVLKSIYVLKCIKRENLSADFYADDDEFGRVPREIQILNYIRKNGGHPSIVKMTNAFNDPKYFYLEMPMHGNGMDLFDYIDLTPLVSELNVQKIFLQICQAIKYLHGHGIVHRDIKVGMVLFVSSTIIRIHDRMKIL